VLTIESIGMPVHQVSQKLSPVIGGRGSHAGRQAERARAAPLKGQPAGGLGARFWLAISLAASR
jgi:hypothetical protein